MGGKKIWQKKDNEILSYDRCDFLVFNNLIAFKEAIKTGNESVNFSTPGNVIRGNQNYANEILTGASGNELQSVDRSVITLFTNF